MIRKATMDDIPLLARIEMASFQKERYPIDEETFYELMLSPAQIILVYEDTRKGVVGHLLAEIMDNQTSLSIDSVAVLPDFRGMGIGKDLVKAALEFAKNRNIPAVSLETPEGDKHLYDFYRSLHFKDIGREENFYGDGSACIIMKLIFALLLLLPLPAWAQDAPKLQMPVACEIGKTCWLVNYPDNDAAPDVARDYNCGPLTYEGHDGSDFGIRDLVAMETGVAVLAAADGKVLRTREGAADLMPDKEEIETLLREKKGCGNGIVLEHASGWQTLYCHMKNGSFKVKEGQTVKAGTPLGLVGHSGVAEFPHLHFTIMKDGKIYDPFSGHIMNTACKTEQTPFWNPPLPYEPVSLYAAGFKTGVPDLDALRIDATAPSYLRREDSPILTFWAMIYGVAAGDKIELEIIGPDSQVVTRRDIAQEKTRARQLYYIGKNFGETLIPAGEYTGVITLTRTEADGRSLIRTRDTLVKIH